MTELQIRNHPGDPLSSLVGQTALTFVAQIVAFVLAFASTTVLARVLGPEGKGMVALIVLIPSMIALFGNLGLGTANVYLIGKKKHPLEEIVGNTTFLFLAITVLTGTAYCIFLPLIRDHVAKGADERLLLVALVILPAELSGTYLTSILLGLGKIGRLSVVRIVRSTTQFLLILLLLVVWRLDILGGVIATAVGMMCGAAIACAVVCRRARVRPVVNKILVRNSIAFGLKAHTGNVLQFFNYRLDYFVVNHFLGAAGLGIYTISVGLAEFIWYIPNSIAYVLFPKNASLDAKTATLVTEQVSRHTLFITTIASLGLFMASKPLIILFFRSDFLSSLLPLWILLPGVVALSLSKVFCADLASRGRPQYGSFAAGISLVVTVVLDLLFIPRYGVVGAALASSLSYTASALIVMVYYLKISGSKIRDVLLVERADLAIYPDTIRRWIHYGE